jgi:hypothetical protein
MQRHQLRKYLRDRYMRRDPRYVPEHPKDHYLTIHTRIPNPQRPSTRTQGNSPSESP